jgi:hypothetical protein
MCVHSGSYRFTCKRRCMYWRRGLLVEGDVYIENVSSITDPLYCVSMILSKKRHVLLEYVSTYRRVSFTI